MCTSTRGDHAGAAGPRIRDRLLHRRSTDAALSQRASHGAGPTPPGRLYRWVGPVTRTGERLAMLVGAYHDQVAGAPYYGSADDDVERCEVAYGARSARTMSSEHGAVRMIASAT